MMLREGRIMFWLYSAHLVYLLEKDEIQGELHILYVECQPAHVPTQSWRKHPGSRLSDSTRPIPHQNHIISIDQPLHLPMSPLYLSLHPQILLPIGEVPYSLDSHVPIILSLLSSSHMPILRPLAAEDLCEGCQIIIGLMGLRSISISTP